MLLGILCRKGKISNFHQYKVSNHKLCLAQRQTIGVVYDYSHINYCSVIGGRGRHFIQKIALRDVKDSIKHEERRDRKIENVCNFKG